jgi:hypothetical protein
LTYSLFFIPFNSVKMGKTGKNMKKRRLANEAAIRPTAPDSDDDEPTDTSFLLGLVQPHELATCTRVLSLITNNPELLKSKAELKHLRGAVFDFQRVAAELSGTGQSFTSHSVESSELIRGE